MAERHPIPTSPNFKDITGQAFGRWKVLYYLGSRNEISLWRCRCECGTERDVFGNGLRNGASESCGCLKADNYAHRRKHKIPTKGLRDITGQKFGKWTVVSYAGRNDNSTTWNCICECGTKSQVNGQNLRTGKTHSCGCAVTTHGASHTAEYRCWSSMIARCYNKNVRNYKDYGGRGISICDRWRHSFENFIADVGLKPTPGHSIDRIDVNGNYEPGNVRWATQKEQCLNQRRGARLMHNGKHVSAYDIAEQYGLSAVTLYRKVKSGMTVEQAISFLLVAKSSKSQPPASKRTPKKSSAHSRRARAQ